MKRPNRLIMFISAIIGFVLLVFMVAFFAESDIKTISAEPLLTIINENDYSAMFPQSIRQLLEDHSHELEYNAYISSEKTVIYSTYSSGAYRYGPSIMKYDDGTMDAWFSAPGNNSTQWDWITYRHYDGVNWQAEKTVLKPSAGTADSCSVCDPGVIYFNGYYYLAYTSTADAKRHGYNNSAFVARAKEPEGPYEKWNGTDWGGKPQAFIKYEDDPRGWGIGEVSFVICNEQLYIYYTYFDTNGGTTRLSTAPLSDDWPSQLEYKGSVCPRDDHDSIDVVYCEDLDTFLAFSIDLRMSDSSRLIVYESADGTDFRFLGTRKTNIDDYAHNLGISKNRDGHIRLDDQLIIGYGYGRGWGRWSAAFRKIELDVHKKK